MDLLYTYQSVISVFSTSQLYSPSIKVHDSKALKMITYRMTS